MNKLLFLSCSVLLFSFALQAQSTLQIKDLKAFFVDKDSTRCILVKYLINEPALADSCYLLVGTAKDAGDVYTGRYGINCSAVPCHFNGMGADVVITSLTVQVFLPVNPALETNATHICTYVTTKQGMVTERLYFALK